MDETGYRHVAEQLRKPHGDYALQIAEKMNESNALLNRRAIELLSPPEGGGIMEIGMGNGFFVREILSAYPSVTYTGYDYSGEMIEEAVRRNREFVRSGQAQFTLGTADQMPFDDASFDIVMGINTVYFWDDPARELTEIRRVLKPEGHLVLGIRPKEAMEKYPFTQYGFTMYSCQELGQLLTQNGFKILQSVQEQEPDQEISGQKVRVEMCVVVAGS